MIERKSHVWEIEGIKKTVRTLQSISIAQAKQFGYSQVVTWRLTDFTIGAEEAELCGTKPNYNLISLMKSKRV